MQKFCCYDVYKPCCVGIEDYKSLKFEDIFPDIKLRPHQQIAFDGIESHRRSMLLHFRRSGKDFLAWLWILYRAITMENTTHHYYFPFLSHAVYVMDQCTGMMGVSMMSLVPRKYKKDYKDNVVYLNNGSRILIKGLDRVLSVGGEGVSFVFSEYALSKSSAQHDYVSYMWAPTEAAKRVKVVYASTPRGFNFYYDLYNFMKDSKDSFIQKVTVDDTNLVSEETIKEKIREHGQEKVDQELYCEFKHVREDKIYSYLLDLCDHEGRITRVVAEASEIVHTAWDIGVVGLTAIIFFTISWESRMGGKLVIKIIDYVEGTKKGIAHYMNVLITKPYNYGSHFLPVDSKIPNKKDCQSYEDTVRNSLIMLKESHGNRILGEVFVLGGQSVINGIVNVEYYFQYFFFDAEKTKLLRRRIDFYRWVVREKDGFIRKIPYADENCHGCDALRYLISGSKEFGLLASREGEASENYYAPKSRW